MLRLHWSYQESPERCASLVLPVNHFWTYDMLRLQSALTERLLILLKHIANAPRIRMTSADNWNKLSLIRLLFMFFNDACNISHHTTGSSVMFWIHTRWWMYNQPGNVTHNCYILAEGATRSSIKLPGIISSVISLHARCESDRQCMCMESGGTLAICQLHSYSNSHPNLNVRIYNFLMHSLSSVVEVNYRVLIPPDCHVELGGCLGVLPLLLLARY